MVDYTRKITHTGYKNPEKVKKYYHRVPKMIYETPPVIDKGFSDMMLVLDGFMVRKDSYKAPWIYGILGGDIFIFYYSYSFC